MPKIEPLLKKKEVAEILNIDERTVDRYREDGIIQTCKIPVVRFSPDHIRELMSVKLEKHSLLEWKMLEKENKELKELLELKDRQLQELKQHIAKAQAFLTQIVYEDVQDKILT